MNLKDLLMRFSEEHNPKVLKKVPLTKEEKAVYEEFKKVEAVLTPLVERMEHSKEKFWRMVELRLEDFDSNMRYNAEEEVIEVLNDTITNM